MNELINKFFRWTFFKCPLNNITKRIFKYIFKYIINMDILLILSCNKMILSNKYFRWTFFKCPLNKYN